MTPTTWILLPLVGAAIGYGTNWLAVKMLFRPRKPLRLPGLTLQGLVPRRQKDLAASVARTVEQEFISKEDIQTLVTDLAASDRVKEILRERVDHLIQEQLASFGPLVRTFVSDDLIDSLKRKIEKEVVGFIGAMGDELHRGLGEHLDIHAMVRERIEGFDLDRLEEIVHSIAKRELRHIEILGGFLGALIGLVPAGLLHLLAAA